ncbi:MAG: hypothetical protein RR806_06975 [Oscillospiraceae bacterium]
MEKSKAKTKSKSLVNPVTAPGKRVSQEQSILDKLFTMVKTKPKAYYILWKYAHHLLPNPNLKTYQELADSYKFFTPGMTEERAETWLTEQSCQAAIKWLLKRLHQQKMIELYNTYYEKAQQDTQAFKAFIDFSDKFFASEQESEMLSILKGVDFTQYDDEDDTDDENDDVDITEDIG